MCIFAAENLINNFLKRSTMKKVFAILLTAVFLTAMSACGDSTTPPAVVDEPKVEEQAPPCNEDQAVDGENQAAEEEGEVEAAQD